MAKDLSSSLKELVAQRNQQLVLLAELSTIQNAIQTKTFTNEDPTISINEYEKLYNNYRKLLISSSQQLKHANECMEKVRKMVLVRESKIKRQRSTPLPHLPSPSSSSSSSLKRELSSPFLSSLNKEEKKVHRDKKMKKESRNNINNKHQQGPQGGQGQQNGLDIWDHSQTILPVGTQVAALVDAHSKPKLWILASIRSFSSERLRYEVIDEDPGDAQNPDPVRKTYILQQSKIIPLPSLAEFGVSVRRQFAKNEKVLAIYPSTTVLYPAHVVQPPKKTKTDEYLLEFVDDDSQQKSVHTTLVVPFPPDDYD